VQLPCTGGDEQYWFVTNNERDEHWAWRNKADETKCLSLPGGSQEIGVQLVLENCDGSDHQLWGAWLDRDGAYSITNLHSSTYRPGVEGGSTEVGAPVIQMWNGDRWPSPDDDEPGPPSAR
jgi:hypothetical protein